MNIYHLRYFTDAVKLGSLSASANKNRVSHSAVSQSIRSLEKFFAGELLHHKKRGFETTEMGRRVFEELLVFLDDFESLQTRIADSGSVPSGSLALIAPQSLLIRNFFGSLKIFRKAYPKVKLKIRTGAAQEIRTRVEEGGLDLGFLVDDGMLGSFEQELLKKGNFVVVSLKPKQALGSEPLIVTQKEKIEVLHLLKNFKKASKKDLEISMEALSWTLIKELTLQGHGHSYLPDYLVANEVKTEKLHLVKLPGDAFEYEIKAIWKKRLSRSAQLFLKLLKQEL
jgi:DNA-binding transcriptional LysR family regulator